MGRATSLLGLASRPSPRNLTHGKYYDHVLPYSEKAPRKRAIRIRTLLGHCLYRRVLMWALASFVLFAFFFSTSDVRTPDIVDFGKTKLSSSLLGHSSPQADKTDSNIVVQDGSHNQPDPDASESEQVSPAEVEERKAVMKKMPWLAFGHLDGYFHGLKALVDKSELFPEYPNTSREAPLPPPPMQSQVRKPQPYNPYHSSEGVRTCYIDAQNKVPAPSMYAYSGVPQHMPDPVFGSYQLFGLRDDVCFDRFGRYGPYGLGYSKANGGVGIGADTENSESEQIWAETGQINYNNVDWGDAQQRCYQANKDRFLEPKKNTGELPTSAEERKGLKGRMAVVVRCYQGFRWTELAILNFRAMVTELSLKSGGEYSVHLLLHIKDTSKPIWSDDSTVQQLLDENVPREFHNLVTVWSEPQMHLFYPGDFADPLDNPSGTDVHGVYRSAHMPLQVFSSQHPEYEHIWNWEMDMRCMGNYYELFDRLGRWADSQPRSLLWERNARYYIPSQHGSWANFSDSVQHQVHKSKEKPIFGPLSFRGRKKLRLEEHGHSVLPESCRSGSDESKCGVGEEADIITLNPLFETHQSGWVFSNDVTGYEASSSSHPPRRCSIVTASRLSRRLLVAMHEETFRHRHSMFSEMFPPTVALHHGFKAVYAPHPTYLDRAWQPLGSFVDASFNSGKDHSTSGRNSPYDLDNEHNHKGTTWYYHSEFSGLLWRRWLGYAQHDGRGKFGGRGGEGRMRGGKAEEESSTSSGRMCLRSMFLHPIKFEHPMEI
ncbi:hypothetical protein CDD82_6958 [Ophiocordyceps australis]|uniref:Glycosyl transferase CAP10 domain-containing protein n=1 Tax=Ophiocordyceps australis TaxID=1399860 RepID=A0A2C5YMI8_9HYPO|nr:hypothetical protein CDD82_6958 [Ophiocordyceps australis]